MRTLLLVAALLGLAACAPDAAGAGTETADPPTATTAPAARRSSSELVSPSTSTTTTATTPTTVRTITVSAPASVAVVGDSLTVAAQEEIGAALTAAGHRVVVVDAVEGRRMAWGMGPIDSGVEAIDRLRSDGVEADVWVIALGTNDLGSEHSFPVDAAAVIDQLPPDAAIVWMNVWAQHRPGDTAEANEVIGSLSSGGVEIADWARHGGETGLVVGDGVHLTQAGELAFAEEITAAVNRTGARTR